MKNKKHSFRVYFKGSFKFDNGLGNKQNYRLNILAETIGQARGFIFKKYGDITGFSISQHQPTDGTLSRKF